MIVYARYKSCINTCASTYDGAYYVLYTYLYEYTRKHTNSIQLRVNNYIGTYVYFSNNYSMFVCTITRSTMMV